MTKSPLVARGRFAAIAAAGLALSLFSAAYAQTALPPPTTNVAADARQDRIEELEVQLRESTAETERVQFDLIQAQREITRLRGTIAELTAANEALSQGVQTPGARAPAAQAAAPPAAPSVQQSAAQPAPPAQQSSLGTLNASDLPGEAGPAYSRARELLIAGNYAEAEAAFARFLQAHADAGTAPDARFWFAYTLLARNNHQEAAAGFVDYLQRYPNGPRAPEAQVRLGMALAGMGQNRQACAAFRDVPRRYPRAGQNVRDLATRESRALTCPA